MIRVAIADDHALVRQGIRRILEAELDIRVVGEAQDGDEALALVRRSHPDVLILDISMPGKDGLEATREIRAQGVPTRILILTMHNEEHYALRTLRAGAQGFLYKGADSEELVRAVRAVSQGITYLPPEIERVFAERFVHPEEADPAERLTDREFQVLRLLAQGRTNREIAEELGIQLKTVDSHRRRILKKLGLRNNAELTRFAIRHGLIEL